MHYSHALWFSVQTSATIGYGGELTPDPYCPATNALVTCQVIVSLLFDYSVLGIVFTRFATPSSRASTIIFSKQIAMTQQDGLWRLTFRVANIRKHQILRPGMSSWHPTCRDQSVVPEVMHQYTQHEYLLWLSAVTQKSLSKHLPKICSDLFLHIWSIITKPTGNTSSSVMLLHTIRSSEFS